MTKTTPHSELAYTKARLDDIAEASRNGSEPTVEGAPGQFMDTGWIPPDEVLSRDEWLFWFGRLWEIKRALPRILGDMLNYGEIHYGETYAQAVDATGYAVNTLYHYKWVCSAVPFEIRQAELSLSHDAVLASLRDRPDLQRIWGRRAVERGWNVDQLREAVRQSRRQLPPPEPEPQLDWLPEPTGFATCPACGHRFLVDDVSVIEQEG